MRELVAILLVCASLPLLQGQRRATAPSVYKPPPAYKGVVVTFHGVLKKLTKKEILLESDDKQLLTLRCDRKTKFQDPDGDVKRSDIDLESQVSIEASEDVDLKLLAINVKADAARKKKFQ